MRRFYRAIVLSFLSVLLISSVALAAWTFKFPTIVQDTSGASRTYYPVDLGYNAATLLSSGKIAANGLNTNMQVGGTDVAYMMDTTRVMAVVPTLGADAMATVDLYTGYTPNQTSFDVVVGEGGYITTADDDDIELGNSFDITLDGYFVTSAAFVGENILYKQDSFRIYVQAAGTIRAAILSAGDVEEKAVDGAVSTGSHVVRIYTSGSTLSFGLDGSRIAHTKLDSTLLTGQEVANSASTWRGEDDYVHHSFYASGRYWVFWGVYNHVYYQSSVDGVTWNGAAEAVSIDSIDDSTFITDGTNVYMAYKLYDDGFYRKGVCNSDGTITWGSLSAISSTTDHLSRPAVLALDTDDNVYCAYVNNDDGDYVYLDKCIAPASTWVSADGFPKKSGLGGFATSVTYTMITAMDDGRIYIGSMDNGTEYDEHGQMWTGAAWGSVEEIDNRWGDDLLSYNDTVYWLKASGYLSTSTYVYTRTYGVGWDGGSDLSKPAGASTALGSCMSVDDSSGDLYVFSTDGTNDKVYYKRYDADTSAWDVNWTELSDETTDTIYFATHDTHLDSFPTVGNGSQVGVVFNTLTAGGGNKKWKYAAIILNDNPVPDTANDYVLMDGDTMPYASEISFDVAGTEVLLYKPNTIVVDTALPDRATADDSQDGVITWGSNSDITITYGLMEGGSGAPTPITPSDTAGFDPGEAAMPDAWFGTCTNASNLPFYDSFYEVSTQTGQSVCDIYFLIMVGVAFGTFLLLTMTTRSALIGVTGFNIILYAASSTGMVPMWIPFATTVVQVGVMFLYKQVAY